MDDMPGDKFSQRGTAHGDAFWPSTRTRGKQYIGQLAWFGRRYQRRHARGLQLEFESTAARHPGNLRHVRTRMWFGDEQPRPRIFQHRA